MRTAVCDWASAVGVAVLCPDLPAGERSRSLAETTASAQACCLLKRARAMIIVADAEAHTARQAASAPVVESVRPAGKVCCGRREKEGGMDGWMDGGGGRCSPDRPMGDAGTVRMLAANGEGGWTERGRSIAANGVSTVRTHALKPGVSSSRRPFRRSAPPSQTHKPLVGGRPCCRPLFDKNNRIRLIRRQRCPPAEICISERNQ